MIAVDAFKLMLFGNQTYRRDIAEQHQSLALRAYSPRPIVAIKHKLEPMVTPRGVVMVIITIILTLAIVEVLFGGMINERMRKRRHRGFAR